MFEQSSAIRFSMALWSGWRCALGALVLLLFTCSVGDCLAHPIAKRTANIMIRGFIGTPSVLSTNKSAIEFEGWTPHLRAGLRKTDCVIYPLSTVCEPRDPLNKSVFKKSGAFDQYVKNSKCLNDRLFQRTRRQHLETSFTDQCKQCTLPTTLEAHVLPMWSLREAKNFPHQTTCVTQSSRVRA